jgi:uncharacterized membrane protein YdjX (TVP38/TMEM64 family)
MTAAAGGGLRHHVRRTVAILFAVGVVVGIAMSSSTYAWIRSLIDRADEIVAQHHITGAVIFVVLSALSAMLAFFSTAIIIPVAIGAWGKLVTFLLLWLGWLAGGGASYIIGRYLGRPAARWFVSEERMRQFEQYADRRLSLLRLLLLQAALPSEIPGYVLGTLEFPPGTYLLALAIVELPFAAGAVYLGDRFLQRDYVILACVALSGLVLMFIAGWLVHRNRPIDRVPDPRGTPHIDVGAPLEGKSAP